jgi:hypothetical protein
VARHQLTGCCTLTGLQDTTTSRGLNLLHLAAMSGSWPTSQLLLSLAHHQQLQLQAGALSLTCPGPGGVTPLHLAAGAPGAAAAELVTALMTAQPWAAVQWLSCAAQDGTTPAMVAHSKGAHQANALAVAAAHRAMPDVVYKALQRQDQPRELQGQQHPGGGMQRGADEQQLHSASAERDAPECSVTAAMSSADEIPSSPACPSSVQGGRRLLAQAGDLAAPLALLVLLALLAKTAIGSAAPRGWLALAAQLPMLLLCLLFTAAALGYKSPRPGGRRRAQQAAALARLLQRLRLLPSPAPAADSGSSRSAHEQAGGTPRPGVLAERAFMALIVAGMLARLAMVWVNYVQQPSQCMVAQEGAMEWLLDYLYCWHLGTPCLLASFIYVALHGWRSSGAGGSRTAAVLLLLLLQQAVLLCRAASGRQQAALVMVLVESATSAVLLQAAALPGRWAAQLIAADVTCICLSLSGHSGQMLLAGIALKLALLVACNTAFGRGGTQHAKQG